MREYGLPDIVPRVVGLSVLRAQGVMRVRHAPCVMRRALCVLRRACA